MAKDCSVCGKSGYAKSKCKSHYKYPSTKKAQEAAKDPESVKPTKKAKKPISQFSAKKIKQMAIYRKLRDQYFIDNPVCEFPFCNSRDITLHHMLGRSGIMLVAVEHFKSLCMEHHNFAEMNPLQAYEMGLSGSRLKTT